MITALLSISTVATEAVFRDRNCSAEVLLLCRNRENDEPLPESRVDRPDLAGSLLGAQLEQVRLAF